ncbi:MAG: threonine/serine dehydratase [SAR202 cluster bacterium]|nr:threonine/serine dehydratase [SAR202 cluster bacterium]
MSTRPTLENVLNARKRIMPHIIRTPLLNYYGIDEMLDAKVFIKHENYQHLGSFKVRGALNTISQLTTEEKNKGVISSSTGNFGQGVAYGGRIFGVNVVIVVPENTTSTKVSSIKSLGAKIIEHGQGFDDARQFAEQLSIDEGYYYIHSANEPRLVEGTGTYTLEILEDQPDIDVIIVPIGGGSGACGACIVSNAVNPNIKVIGVQSNNSPGAYFSWKDGNIIEKNNKSLAEGLATSMGYEYTQQILKEMLDDFILVSDEELLEAVVLFADKTHSIVEHAGAAPLAAALQIKDQLKGKKVALIASGGNLSLSQLKDALN